MFTNPYHTTALRRFQTARIIDALEQERILSQITKLKYPYPEVYVLLGNHPSQRNIPQFDQVIKLPNGDSVIDLRPYRSTALHYIELDKEIPSGPAAVLLAQAELQTIWDIDERHRLRLANLSDLPVYVYSHWLGETISRQFKLNPAVSLDVITICAWFWTCLFYDDLHIDQAKSYLYASKLSRVVYDNVDNVAARIREVGYIKDLAALCEALQKLPIPRSEDINVGSVITAVAGTWFGSVGAKQQIGVAIEHPPTFIAILKNAISGAGYRNSTIATIAERFDKRRKYTAFFEAYRGVIAIGE